MPKKRTPVRIPQQKRSIQTKQRIMDAARRLFAQKGFHEINSNIIAAEAGVSIGSFYSYFTDKKDLFVTILKQHNEVFLEQVSRELTLEMNRQGNPRAIFLGMLQGLISDDTFAPEFLRQVVAMRFSDPEIAPLYDSYEEMSLHNMMTLFQVFGDALKVKDPEAAAHLVHSLSKELILSYKVFPPKIDQDRLLREYVDMIFKYLFDI